MLLSLYVSISYCIVAFAAFFANDAQEVCILGVSFEDKCFFLMHCHFRALALAVDAALLPYMHLSPDKQFSDVISLVAAVFNLATHLQTGGGCGGGATAAAAFVCLPPLPC